MKINPLNILLVAVLLGSSKFANAQPGVTSNPQNLTSVPAKVSVSRKETAIPHATLLGFDSMSKNFEAKPGELTAQFTFYVTNLSAQAVVITNLQRSCGCTDATMPAQPWNLAPGASGPIHATIDLRGKAGKISKQLTVQGPEVREVLLLNVNIPQTPTANLQTNSAPPVAPAGARMDRERAQQMATLDRQAVFKGDCAKCHAEPTVGKVGADLYQAGCGICHEAENRASMVPDLHHLAHPTGADHWRQWITDSRPGSMMPAFSVANGGPLTARQIDSLVDYLTRSIRSL